MSAAPATAALPNNPDPLPDQATARAPTRPRIAPDSAPGPAITPAPTQSHVAPDLTADSAITPAPTQSRAGRVLSLLRKLIDYGQDLARSVQQYATAGTLLTIAVHFGTRDMALILARITRGLRLASALEARLVSRPPRLDAAPAVVRAPPDPTNRTTRPTIQRPALPEIPTAEEIAAALRHRSAAAVIGDICRDLGIVPAHPLWEDVMMVLSEHGGNFVQFVRDVIHRLFAALDPAAEPHGHPASRSQPAAACGTGPP